VNKSRDFDENALLGPVVNMFVIFITNTYRYETLWENDVEHAAFRTPKRGQDVFELVVNLDILVFDVEWFQSVKIISD
jgi:hypothetical protein